MHFFSFQTLVSKFLFFVFQSIFDTHKISFHSVVMHISIFLFFGFLISNLWFAAHFGSQNTSFITGQANFYFSQFFVSKIQIFDFQSHFGTQNTSFYSVVMHISNFLTLICSPILGLRILLFIQRL